jgi:hypothetical protein
MILTRACGRPSASASAVRISDGDWLPDQIVSASPSQSARAPRTSSGDGAQRPWSNGLAQDDCGARERALDVALTITALEQDLP